MSSPRYDLAVDLLDVEGIVFNKHYQEIGNEYLRKSHKWLIGIEEEKAILSANQDVVEFIAQHAQMAKKAMIGYFSHLKQQKSSHDALLTIRKKLQEQVPDRYNLKVGAETRASFHGVKHANSYLDFTRISILYANMQQLVMAFPGKKIHLTVWESRSTLVQWLYPFFSDESNRQLIPEGVTLSFCHDCQTQRLPEIEGQGQVNPFYAKTLAEFYESDDYELFKEMVEPRGEESKDEGMGGLVFSNLVEIHKDDIQMRALREDKDADDRAEEKAEKEEAEEVASVLGNKTFAEVKPVPPPTVRIQGALPESMHIMEALNYCHGKPNPELKLVNYLFKKIERARSSEEVIYIIGQVSEYDNVLEELKDTRPAGKQKPYWNGEPISATFTRLIKLAKYRILHLYKEKNGAQLSPEDSDFLRGYRGASFRLTNTRSYFLFEGLRLSAPTKREQAGQEVEQKAQEYAESFKKRYKL